MTKFLVEIEKKWLATLLLGLAGWHLFAQQIQVEIDPQQPRVGESFEVKLILENIDGEMLAAPNFGKLQRLGGPNSEMSAQIINGKVSRRQAWGYILRATEAGEYPVSGGRFRVGRNTMSLNEFVISVKKTANNSPTLANSGDREIFIATELSTEKAFVGQQIVVSWVLYTAIGAESFDLLEEPRFDGFFVKELHRVGNRTRDVTIGKRQYLGRLLKSMAVFPQKTGKLVISEARFAVAIPVVGASNDPFSQFFGRPTKQILLHSDAKTLDVLPLPEPSPAQFSGGVGEYSWKITADRTELTTDEALTLKIEVEGNGDPNRFALPALSLPDGLESFEPNLLDEGQFENSDELRHEKILEIAVLPRQTGTFDIAPSFLYFSPKTQKYEVAKIENPLKINVLQGKTNAWKTTIPDSRQVSPLRTEADWQPIDKKYWWQQPIFWLASLLPLLVVFALYFYQKRKQQQAEKMMQSPDFQQNRQKAEWQTMLSACQTFKQSGDAPQFFDGIERLLFNYFSKKLELPPAEFSQKKVLERWSAAGASETDLKELQAVWQACELSKFGGTSKPEKMNEVLEWVKILIMR